MLYKVVEMFNIHVKIFLLRPKILCKELTIRTLLNLVLPYVVRFEIEDILFSPASSVPVSVSVKVGLNYVSK